MAIRAQRSLFDLRERSEIGTVALSAGAAGVGDAVRLDVFGVFIFHNAGHGRLQIGNNDANTVSHCEFNIKTSIGNTQKHQ